MTKNAILAEHIGVTFLEAAIAYLSVNQTNLHGNFKLVAIGALGAGLSAAYNVLRQSTPTIPATTAPVAPEAPLNGVTQLTANSPGMPTAPVEPPAPTV